MPLTIAIHTPSSIPLEVDSIRMENVRTQSADEVKATLIQRGNKQVTLGELIQLSGYASSTAEAYLPALQNYAQAWKSAHREEVEYYFIGHSMGGYITLRAMVANQNIKAGVIWAGVVASYAELFNSWFGGDPANTRPSWRSTMVAENGTPSQNPTYWNALSANAYLTDLSGPIQLHHGTGDTTVPFNYSVMLNQQIQAVGGSCELFLYPNDDHNIAANRDNALVLSVVFFNQHVKNVDG